MANYTIELRQIENCLCYLFPKGFPFYTDSEELRKNFIQKFYDEYMFREIGFETTERFKRCLLGKLNLIMPYYEQLYKTELESKDINFMLNKDLKETFIREIDTENQTSGTNTTQQNSTSSSSASQSGTSSNTHKESSINDGVAQVSLNDGYLTGASSDTGDTTNTGTASSTDDIETTGTSSQTGNEKMVEKTDLLSQGNIGITSSAQLLKEWREVLINMDKIIIDSCSDLFLKIY